MTRHDPMVSMQDMLSHAQEAIQLLGDMNPETLAANRERQLALTRLVEIVGEAANRVPVDFQEQYPQLPWRKVVGMRNLLAHGYDIIEYEIIHDTIRDSLPSLIVLLESILKNSGED